MSTIQTSSAFLPLRARAEMLLESGNLPPHPAKHFEMERVLYELEVQQAELEIQNEELRRIQGDFETASESSQDLYDFAPVGLLILDSSARVAEANLAAASQLGVPRDELVGRLFLDFVAAMDQEVFRLRFSEVCSQGEKSDMELHLRSVSIGKAVFSARLQFSATRARGRSFCRVAIVDVTDYVQTETELRVSRQRFRTLAEAIPQIVWTTDGSGVLTYFSQNLLSYVDAREGVNSLEIWKTMLHPEDRSSFAAAWSSSIGTGKPLDIQFRLVKSGEPRWHLCRALQMCDADGGSSGWYGTWTDIHEQKCSEARLKEAAVRKDEFLAILAHELRNPLATIQSTLALDRLDISDEKKLWGRDVAGRQVKHLARLIDDLLDVARISQGKIQLKMGSIDLQSVISRSVDVVRPLAAERQHELILSMPVPKIMLEADQTRLEQVLVNLLSNAVKYTEPGGKISLDLTKAGQEIRIAISDNGSGIEPVLLTKIFDLFFQQRNSMDRLKGGLGIGLTLVKRLVELHGGSIQAHSDGKGKGSTFVVTLTAPAAVSEPSAVNQVSDSEVPKSTWTGRILLVDDNSDELVAMKLLLEHAGHTVRTACDGRSALQEVSHFRPDIAIIDLGLPGMNGFEVAGKMRDRLELSGCKLIALTGFGQVQDRLESEQAGFSLHLTKPIAYEDLLDQIQCIST